MSESTTTAADPGTGADPSAQPGTGVDPAAAATQPQEPQTTTTSNEDTNQAGTDDNLEWLQKKGIDPNSPEALSKVAEMYRNAEKTMHESTEKASNLERTITESSQKTAEDTGLQTDPNEDRIRALETKTAVSEFFARDDVDSAMRPKMAEYVKENPQVGLLFEHGYLNLQNIYDMTKGSDAGLETQLKTEGGREALQRVADKQQAKAVHGAATSSAMGTPPVTKANFDEWYSGLSAAERAKPETQKIVNGLLSQ
jgi:hypothetical protein